MAGRLVTRLDLVNHGQTSSIHLEFSPRSKYLAAALPNGSAQVWEMGTWRSSSLRGHRGEVHHISFSPDEHFAATAGEDKVAKIWDVADGHTVGELRGHSGAVNDVEFSLDGRMLVTASEDHTAKVYRCNVCTSLKELVTIAEAQLTRPLTPGERTQYLHEMSPDKAQS